MTYTVLAGTLNTAHSLTVASFNCTAFVGGVLSGERRGVMSVTRFNDHDSLLSAQNCYQHSQSIIVFFASTRYQHHAAEISLISERNNRCYK